MKDKSIMRDTYGRVMGKLDGYWFHTHEDESYQDYKVRGCDVRFPEHNDNQSSPVTITYLNNK